MRRPIVTIISFLVAAGGVAAYLTTRGRIDTSDADAKLKAIVEDGVAPVTKVECPQAKRKKGTTFDCRVEFAAGRAADLTVDIIDDEGGFKVHWAKVPLGGAEKLATMIETGIKSQTGKVAKVDCGKGIVDVPPDGLECKVTVGNETAHAKVKEDPSTHQMSWAVNQ
jgi:hypothetical protein